MHKLLIVCGPTTTGKTALAISLAKQFNGECIAADSRQVYRGMDIGTGKDFPEGNKTIISSRSIEYKKKQYTIPAYDFDGVPLWMYDVVHPDEEFTVSHYQHLGKAIISDCISRGKLPIIVGGTGLYIDALVHSIPTAEISPDPELRRELSGMSVESLRQKLQSLSPQVFSGLNNSDAHNPRRLVRKIERTMAGSVTGDVHDALFDALWIGLEADIEVIKMRIDSRVDSRMKHGHLKEIQTLIEKGYGYDLPSMTGLGYMQWKGINLENAVAEDPHSASIISLWKTKELQYAKRQMTWFKKNKDIHWFVVTENDFLTQVEQEIASWLTHLTHVYSPEGRKM